MSEEPTAAEVRVNPLGNEAEGLIRVSPAPGVTRWRLLMNEVGVVVLSVAGLFTFMKGVDLVLELFPSARAQSTFNHRGVGWLLAYASALLIAGIVTMRLAARKQKELAQQKKRLRYQRWKQGQSVQGPIPSGQ